jgi:MFS family permease
MVGHRSFSVLRSGLMGLLIGIVLVQAGKMLAQPFLAIYVVQVLHASFWMVGLSYGMTALGLCLSAARWARRFKKLPDELVQRDIERVLWTCVGISILQAICSQILWFQLIRLCWGICLGALLPVFYMLLSRSAGQVQGYVLGLGNSAAKAGALLGTGIGAAAMLWLPVSWLFWVVVCMYVLAAVGMRLLRLTDKSKADEASQQLLAG